MLENNLTSSSDPAISNADIVEFFEKLTNDENPSKEEMKNLLTKENAIQYFKYNIKHYCELHVSIMNEIEDSNEFIHFLSNENSFNKLIRCREKFYVSFFEILFPKLIEVAFKFSKDERVFNEASRSIQEVCKYLYVDPKYLLNRQ
jgi:hypothetical protein